MDIDKYQKIKTAFQKRKAEKAILERSICKQQEKRSKLLQTEARQKEARIIFQTVAAKTQENLKYCVSNLVTMAVKAIFGDGIEFKMAIERRRNQTEIDFFVEEYGNLQEPLDSNGYGLVDVISLALRISYWSLKKTRGIFILDEPFRNLSRNHSKAASKLLKYLCTELGLQMIVVSHDTEITKYADKIFRVEKQGKFSTVEEIEI